jgi:iron complex outermembrane receptor protein
MGMSYEAPLGGGLSLIPSLNASWRSESETGTSQVSFFDQGFTSSPGGIAYPVNTAYRGAFITGSYSKARWIANASITLKSEGGWSLVAECKNCFDEEAVESSLVNYSYLNPPRTWAIRANYKF